MKRLVLGVLQDSFLRRFNLRLSAIVAVLPTELPVLEVRGQRTDLLFLLAHGTILHLHFGRPVYTVVVYGRGIKAAPATLGGGSLTFQARNIYMSEQDADATLQALRDSPDLRPSTTAWPSFWRR